MTRSPNLTGALAADDSELRRRVDAFHLAVALDRNAGRMGIKALISSAFTNTRIRPEHASACVPIEVPAGEEPSSPGAEALLETIADND